MIQPAKREEFRRLQHAAEGSTKDMKEQANKMFGSLRTTTLAEAIDQHPIKAVCVAAIGGCVLSRVLGLRGLRMIAMLAAQSVAQQAISAVAKEE